MIGKRHRDSIAAPSRRAKTSKAKRGLQESPVDLAFRKIKEMMYHHEIVPGQKLLYQELARKLGMSITPVIQALNRLQLLNIVYSERNKGYYVGEADPEEAKQLFEALEALQGFVLPAVVENLTEERLQALQRAMEEHVEAASAPEYRRILMLKDTHFHLRVVEYAENKVIYNLCKLILEQIYLKYRPEYMRDERLREAAEEHEAILETLRRRDVAKARRLLRQHMRKAREHIVGSLLEEKGL
jgi:DNA-binding GntR family transcriptional regulator